MPDEPPDAESGPVSRSTRRSLLIVGASVATVALLVAAVALFGPNRRRDAITQIESHGGEVILENQWFDRVGGHRFGSVRAVFLLTSATIWDADIVALFRDLAEIKSVVAQRSGITDAALLELSSLRKLELLNLMQTRVSDVGLANLRGATNLKWLELGRTRITDQGLIHVKEFRALESLLLQHTQITDAGLKHLGALKGLQRMDLSGTSVTSQGLAHLKKLRSLKILLLHEIGLSGDDVAELQKALPDCVISR